MPKRKGIISNDFIYTYISSDQSVKWFKGCGAYYQVEKQPSNLYLNNYFKLNFTLHSSEYLMKDINIYDRSKVNQRLYVQSPTCTLLKYIW